MEGTPPTMSWHADSTVGWGLAAGQAQKSRLVGDARVAEANIEADGYLGSRLVARCRLAACRPVTVANCWGDVRELRV